LYGTNLPTGIYDWHATHYRPKPYVTIGSSPVVVVAVMRSNSDDVGTDVVIYLFSDSTKFDAAMNRD
jgi:hypothetical protein